MLIRKAEKSDVSSILTLIKELAIYEKEPHAVKATESDLLRDGFGERPRFECLVSEVDGVIEGFALYFYKWSTWEGGSSLHLEDLYVREAARGKGLGFHLFQRLAQIAVENNCSRFEWEVLDWNQPARDFYEKLGAFHKKGWLSYRLTGKPLQSLATNRSLMD